MKLNQKARVKLTPIGVNVWRDYCKDLVNSEAELAKLKDGWLTEDLFAIFAIFGKTWSLPRLPFKEIELVEPKEPSRDELMEIADQYKAQLRAVCLATHRLMSNRERVTNGISQVKTADCSNLVAVTSMGFGKFVDPSKKDALDSTVNELGKALLIIHGFLDTFDILTGKDSPFDRNDLAMGVIKGAFLNTPALARKFIDTSLVEAIENGSPMVVDEEIARSTDHILDAMDKIEGAESP